jgi:hypothetical protein
MGQQIGPTYLKQQKLNKTKITNSHKMINSNKQKKKKKKKPKICVCYSQTTPTHYLV